MKLLLLSLMVVGNTAMFRCFDRMFRRHTVEDLENPAQEAFEAAKAASAKANARRILTLSAWLALLATGWMTVGPSVKSVLTDAAKERGLRDPLQLPAPAAANSTSGQPVSHRACRYDVSRLAGASYIPSPAPNGNGNVDPHSGPGAQCPFSGAGQAENGVCGAPDADTQVAQYKGWSSTPQGFTPPASIIAPDANHAMVPAASCIPQEGAAAPPNTDAPAADPGQCPLTGPNGFCGAPGADTQVAPYKWWHWIWTKVMSPPPASIIAAPDANHKVIRAPFCSPQEGDGAPPQGHMAAPEPQQQL
jgi:hypothetical protein